MSMLPINILQQYLARLKNELEREDEKETARHLESMLHLKHRDFLIKKIQDIETAINELNEKGEG